MNQPVRGRTVLLVDDNPADVHLFRRYLSREDVDDVEIIEAADGETGLELVRSIAPDVVLLDYDLPDLDGLEFLDEIQALADSVRPVVLAITGQSDPRIAAELIRRGALDYIGKDDAGEETVRLAVRQALRARSMRLDIANRAQAQEFSRLELVASLERASYLAKVSEALIRSLAVDEVVEAVARLAIPELADAAFVDVLDAGMLVRRGVALGPAIDQHPEIRLPLRAPELDGGEGAPKAVRAGKAASYARSWLPAIARFDPDVDALARGIGLASVLVVPLSFDRRALGALTLCAVTPRDDHMPGTAEEVARRASAALANARAFEAERIAKRAAEASRRRLNIVSRISALFARSLDWRVTSESVADLLVPTFCDHAAVIVREDGELRTAASRSADEAVKVTARRFAAAFPLDGSGPVGASLQDGKAEYYADAAALVVPRGTPQELHPSSGFGSVMIVPIVAPDATVLGAMLLATGSDRRFAIDDLAVAEDLGRRTGMYLENARLFERERGIARALQTSLLPAEIPSVAGLDVAARNVAGSRDAEVGGDWYDVVALPRGRVAFAVGDVAGRGVLAAATMGQLRSSLRAYALEGLDPSDALARLNAFVLSQERMEFATVAFGVLNTRDGSVVLASAGHLPPVLLEEDGRTSLLAVASSLPVGLVPNASYEQRRYLVAAGSTLLLYTDGLVESRTRAIDEGISALREVLGEPARTVEERLETVLRRVPADAGDDVTILALQYLGLGASEHGDERERVLRLTYPAVPQSAPSARKSVEGFARSIGLDDARLMDLQVAVGEALANAVEHAYADGEAGVFSVRAVARGDRLVVEIIDQGRWRDAAPKGRGSLAERGRGVSLMRALCEQVRIDRGVGGTRVRLTLPLERDTA